MKKLYLRTFGCQMNEYDSDKIADVLREAEGLALTPDAGEADVIVFNTCSVREKAQEKVFADLGRVKHLKRSRPGLMIAVGGCVASQEGPAIVERAPYVDVVFGPQTLHRLPQLLERRRATGQPQVDVSFPEIEKFDHLPPAPKDAAGASAFVSIMEGCSKYCSFCVVPYTRGEEVSRPFEDVVAEIAASAGRTGSDAARPERERLARGRSMAQPADFAELLRYVCELGRRARALHHVPPARIHAAPDRRARGARQARAARPPAGAVGRRPRARGDEARLHRARIPLDRAPPAPGAARHQPVLRLHRRLSRRDRGRLRGDAEARRATPDFDASFSFLYSPRPGNARGRARR